MKEFFNYILEHKIFTMLLAMMVTLVAFLIVFSSILGYYRFYPFEPIKISYLAIDRDEANVGDEVCTQIVGEKLMPLPVKATLTLENGKSIELEKYNSNTPMGNKFPSRCFTIPMHVKTSWYNVRWCGVYEISGNRNVTRTVQSKPIYIMNHWKSMKGERGLQGIQGKRGLTGDKGATGGYSIFGSKPVTGSQGPPGHQGIQGKQGPSGKSCDGDSCK